MPKLDKCLRLKLLHQPFTSRSASPVNESDPTSISRQELLNILSLQQSTHQQLAAAMTLPQPEVPKFKGDPIEYKTFTRAFDARIESRATNDADRLYYLEQHVQGEARDLIGGCMHMDHEQGYREARRLLEQEYGNQHKVAMAYLRKVLEWQNIKPDDAIGLKHFSFFLWKCKSAMDGIDELSVLNHTPNLQAIVSKLPQYAQNKWRDIVYKLKMSRVQPGFSHLVEFVKSTSDVANDPIFSKEALSKKNDSGWKVPVHKKVQQESTQKKSSFATNTSKQEQAPANDSCPLCNKAGGLSRLSKENSGAE